MALLLLFLFWEQRIDTIPRRGTGSALFRHDNRDGNIFLILLGFYVDSLGHYFTYLPRVIVCFPRYRGTIAHRSIPLSTLSFSYYVQLRCDGLCCYITAILREQYVQYVIPLSNNDEFLLAYLGIVFSVKYTTPWLGFAARPSINLREFSFA